jgi:hypothetical protein
MWLRAALPIGNRGFVVCPPRFVSICFCWKDAILTSRRLAFGQSRRCRVSRPDRQCLTSCAPLLLGSECVAVRVLFARFCVAAEM